MHLSRCASALVLLASFAVAANGQTEKTFPTDDEINLLLTQTERAIQQYKPLIDQEEAQMGKAGAQAAAKDRELLNGLETALKAFRAKPQAFNGPLGLTFFAWLDDADRNALLCGSGALSQADSLTQLAQSCSNASSLIYTVSENADSLYERYVRAEVQLATQGVETAQKCMAALKNTIPPKK